MTKPKPCPHCAAKDAEIKRLKDAAADAIKASADHEQRMAQQRTRDGR